MLGIADLKKLSQDELYETLAAIEGMERNPAWMMLAEQLKKNAKYTRNDLKPIHIDPDCGDAIGNMVAQNIIQNAKLDKSIAFDSVLQWMQDAKAFCEKHIRRRK